MISSSGLMRVARGLKRSIRWPDDQPYSSMAWKVLKMERGEVVKIHESELGEFLGLLDEDDFNNVGMTTYEEESDMRYMELREEQQH
jgi:hypothetical protein